MQCYFLADDRDPRLWAAVQDNFHKHTPDRWKVERFSLLPDQSVTSAWQDLMARRAQWDQPFLVMSAGCMLGAHSCQTIESSVGHLSQSGGFDLLFSDLRLMQAGPMADLFPLRRSLVEAGRTRLIDPKSMGFAAPGACVIHPRAVSALGSRGDGAQNFAELLDQALCQPVREGTFMGRFIFPFATTVTSGDDGSVPADKAARAAAIGDIYRRMVWRDGGGEPELQPIAEMSKGLSTEAKALAILWAALAD